MKWISISDSDIKGKKFFWRSVGLPVLWWLFISLTMGIILYVSILNNNIILFENIISAIPYLLNFEKSIVATFGTLLLTLFINAHAENKSEWSSTYDYIRGFAYQRYVNLIAWFLSTVWFINFIYRVWSSINLAIFPISNIPGQDLQGKNIWDIDNHGKFLGNEVPGDIPSWVFLFLSWFVISMSLYMYNNKFAIHYQVISSYEDISYISSQDKTSHKLAQAIIKIHETSDKNRYKESKKAEWRDNIKTIFPGNKKSKGAIYYIGKFRSEILRVLYIFIPMYIVIISCHVSWVIYSLNTFYGANFEIRTENSVIIIIWSLWMGALLVTIGFFSGQIPKLKIMNDTNIYKKGKLRVFYYGIHAYLILIESVIFMPNFIYAIMFHAGESKPKYDGSTVWYSMIIPIIASISILHIFYIIFMSKRIKKVLQKRTELVYDIYNRYGIDKDLFKINIFYIARIVYLEMNVDDSYREYVTLHESFGTAEDSVEYNYKDDLEKAYKVAKKNNNKFPRSANLSDIF